MTAEQRVYQVRHQTAYTYRDDVTTSYGRAFLIPRDVEGQWCRSTRIDVEPAPGPLSESRDYFGNRSVYFEVRTAHRRLVVTSTSVVEVDRAPADLSALDGWTVAGAAAAVAPAVEAREFLIDSPLVPAQPDVAAYAARALPPSAPLGSALQTLIGQIHDDFAYRAGSTSVTTTLSEVLARREGVCQDFTHLAVGCLRSAGLPARYVSGYLETAPPPGRPRLQGADASHAWVSVLVPSLGWVDLDPTNDEAVDARYVVTAWGRDYRDVPPLKGVIFTESTQSELAVAVDVTRLA